MAVHLAKPFQGEKLARVLAGVMVPSAQPPHGKYQHYGDGQHGDYRDTDPSHLRGTPIYQVRQWDNHNLFIQDRVGAVNGIGKEIGWRGPGAKYRYPTGKSSQRGMFPFRPPRGPS